MRYLLSVLAVILSLGFGPATAENDEGGIFVAASLVDADGVKRTCADETVFAIGEGRKSTKTMKQIYDSDTSGFASIYSTTELILVREGNRHVGGSTPKATRLFRKYFPNMHRTKCNADGELEFDELKQGNYYVIVPIFWKDERIVAEERSITINMTGQNKIIVYIPMNYRGGTYMVRLPVESGQETAIELKDTYDDEAT